MLALYHYPTSVCAGKVRAVLAEKRLDWESRVIDILAGEQFEDWYRKLNPSCVVPTLIHDDKVICESAVICEYLEDAFPEPPLRPEGLAARAQMRVWAKDVETHMAGNCAGVTFPATHRFEVLKLSPPELQAFYDGHPNQYLAARKKSWIEEGYQSADAQRSVLIFDTFLRKMEVQLGKTPWLGCDQYTIADASATPYLVRLDMLNYLDWLDLVGTRVKEWYARIKARPSFMPAFYEVMTDEYLSTIRKRGTTAWPEVRQIILDDQAKKNRKAA
jgi:glutathione S-transferase